jgi:hypothetical protein
MAFLMRVGTGKTVALYTVCADEDHCKAELLLLLEKAPPDARVLGYYDVDPAVTVERFMQSYQGKRQEEINRALVKVRLGSFKFKQVGIPRLVMGVDQPVSTKDEEAQRLDDLKATVEFYIPHFAEGVKRVAETMKQGEKPTMLLHQDAFAAGYHTDEYTLLGMAVKYAGIYGVGVTIHGANHETF